MLLLAEMHETLSPIGAGAVHLSIIFDSGDNMYMGIGVAEQHVYILGC